MRTIYKYPLDLVREQVIEAPIPAKVKAVKVQGDQLCVWIQVDSQCVGPNYWPRQRHFIIVGTGQELPSQNYHYIDTVLLGQFVWHVYCMNYEDEEGGTSDY